MRAGGESRGWGIKNVKRPQNPHTPAAHKVQPLTDRAQKTLTEKKKPQGTRHHPPGPPLQKKNATKEEALPSLKWRKRGESRRKRSKGTLKCSRGECGNILRVRVLKKGGNLNNIKPGNRAGGKRRASLFASH